MNVWSGVREGVVREGLVEKDCGLEGKAQSFS